VTMSALLGIIGVVWLLSCGASLLSLYWSTLSGFERRVPALISCGVALLLAYLGLTRIQFHASKTVNGQVVWSFNSKWFFVGALVLAGVSLSLALWNWRKANRPSTSGALPTSGPATTSGKPTVTGGSPPTVWIDTRNTSVTILGEDCRNTGRYGR
jgi:hypothetical protein